MLDLKGIEKSLSKLKSNKEPGLLRREPSGRAEIRYSYVLNEEMVFTFGLTRSSKARSKKYHYVPHQMGLINKEYRMLHDCPWSKADYNNKLANNE